MKILKLFAVLVLSGFVVACGGKDCADKDVQATVLNIVNTNLCQNCVTQLNAIRLAASNEKTGATMCQATMTVTSGFFTGERNVMYKIETTSDGKDYITILGVPKYFNMSGK